VLLLHIPEEERADHVIEAKLVNLARDLLAHALLRAVDDRALLHRLLESVGRRAGEAGIFAILAPQLGQAEIMLVVEFLAARHRLGVGLGDEHLAMDADRRAARKFRLRTFRAAALG